MQPQYITLPKRAKNVANQRFGRLVALGPIGQSKRGNVMWLCQCDCGNTKSVAVESLRKGHTRSCGCLHNDIVRIRSTTHGMAKTSLHRTWQGMIQRCTNPNNTGHVYWIGRGITVCDKWLYSFESFRNHVSDLPHYGEKGYSLDRIDNNGNYEPGNVKWSTAKEQQRNTRHNVQLTYNGKTQCVAAWAEELGISSRTLHSRLTRRGWSVEQSLSTPPGVKRSIQ